MACEFGGTQVNLSRELKSIFNKVCKKKGIQQVFTDPDTSKQNGIAERTNRTVAERMRCMIIESRSGFEYWPEAARMAAVALNHTDKKTWRGVRYPNGTCAYNRMTGLKSGAEDLQQFMAQGEAVIRRKKDNAERSIPVRLLGYSENTKGFKVVSMSPDDKTKGKRYSSSHVSFKSDSTPLAHGHTKQQDSMVTQAVDPDPRKSDDHLYAPIDSGIPVGLEDHELRKRADETDNTVITYRNTTHHHISTNDADENKISQPKRGGGKSMSSKEAKHLFEEFLASEGTDRPLYAHYHEGKSDFKADQRGDYEVYKRIRTPSDFKAARADAKGLKGSFNGHFKYDIQHHTIRISADKVDSALAAGTVKVDVNQLVGSIDPLQLDILKDDPSILQKFYELNSGKFENAEDLRELIRDTEANIEALRQGDKPKDSLPTLFARHAYASAMIGEDRTKHKELADQFAYAVINEIVCGRTTPANDAEAKQDEHWEESWLPALQKEIKALFDMGTFEYVPRSAMEKEGYRTKKTKTVYKWKIDRDGNIEKAKCRIVVQGFNLIPNREYFDSFSSVLSHASMRMLAYISAQTGESLSSADVGNAYLEAPLYDNVFIEQHPECESSDYPAKDYVIKLKKCLYGLPQAGRGYQNTYNKVMADMGFKRLRPDGCLFIKTTKEGRIICGNYVDDLICLTKSEKLRDEWRQGLQQRFGTVTFSDTCDYLLGIKIDQGTDTEGRRYVELNNATNIEKVARLADVNDSFASVRSPMEATRRLHKKTEGEDDNSKYVPNYEYAQVLGGIMYIANTSRPDLLTPVNRLARYVQDPSHTHYKSLTGVVAHAYQTKDRALRYTQVPEDKDHDPFRLWAASDSSFADCPDTGRSTIGRCIWMGKKRSGLIDWASQVPKTVATSTTEAEVQAAHECAKDILYTRDLLHSLGYPQGNASTRLLVDNNSAITQIRAIAGVSKARHYVVALRKLQEVYHLGLMHPQRVDSVDNPADIFTKPLPPAPFWRHSTSILGDQYARHENVDFRDQVLLREFNGGSVKELIRDIDPDAYTKPKLSASKAERKTAKAARREEVNRRKAVQEETSLIAMRVFEKLLARESRFETTDEDSQSKQASADASTGSDLFREEKAILMAHARRFSQSRTRHGFAKI